MFEDEKREQNFNEDQNISENRDISEKRDTGSAEGSVEGTGFVMTGMSSYGADPANADSREGFSAANAGHTRTDSAADYSNSNRADAEYTSAQGYSREYSSAQDTSEGKEYSSVQDTSERKEYSYIPNDTDPGRGSSGSSRRAKPGKRRNNYAKAVGCAVLCGVIIGACIIGSFAIGRNAVQSNSYASVATTSANLSTVSSDESDSDAETVSDGTEYTVAQIAEQCSSSVVAITTLTVSEVQTMFGVYEQESEGSGSGVIISQTDTELLIATNYHVIEGYEELTVCFNDSEDAVYTGQVKGSDSSNDLAVVAVQLSDIDADVLNTISIATIGDSDTLQVGDGVVAIGNALGLGQSVTAGIVSALDREVTIDDVTYNLLQTDAAINAGNSGGALFNMKGELIGINTAKFSSDSSSSSASIDNMGFAIPMSTALPIIEELMNQETRTKLTENYGCLNITGSDVSSDVAEMYGVPEGVYVASVIEGGAAEKAGIQTGDIITSLGGTTVSSISDLQDMLKYYAAGETVEVIVQRNSGSGYESVTLTVTLDNASEQDTSSSTSSSTQDDQSLDDGYTYGDQDSSGSDNSQNGGFSYH
ncbi:MAG: trypsin-like peptidase domain-containing protein [Lachnospiraceae bacterium]|nr:trypsin-like peptidase domain-containing protein [Lachnospiraceae bacterium]